MTAIAGVIGAVGSIISGIAGMQAANYQAKVAEMNANIANENARRAIERGQLEQQAQDQESAVLLGQQEAAQGASGLQLTGRSATLTRKSALRLARRDALNVRQGAEIESYNYKVDAANQTAQAKLYRMEGRNALLGGFINGFSSLASRASSVASPGRFLQ